MWVGWGGVGWGGGMGVGVEGCPVSAYASSMPMPKRNVTAFGNVCAWRAARVAYLVPSKVQWQLRG